MTDMAIDRRILLLLTPSCIVLSKLYDPTPGLEQTYLKPAACRCRHLVPEANRRESAPGVDSRDSQSSHNPWQTLTSTLILIFLG